MGPSVERDLVQQFIAHAAIEALDVAALHRSGRRDIMPLHPDLCCPSQQGIAGELGAMIAYDLAAFAPLGDQRRKLMHGAVSGDRVSRTAAKHSGHVIGHIEHPEASARSHLVVNEGYGPALVRM